MRINKYLAEKGYASRRGADILIQEKAVQVNGNFAVMGQQIDPENDCIEVNKTVLQHKAEEKRYFILNKPEGYTCSTKKTANDPDIITDFFPSNNFPRLYPVGRLDKDSCGLVLMTNDGDLTYTLMHPSHQHEKEYIVEIYNDLTAEMLNRLQKPFSMLGQKTKRAQVFQEGKRSFRIILTEGKNRQIRRMVRSIGSGVKTLQRIRIENISLPQTLKKGDWKEVNKNDILGNKKTFS